jgi:hypothetical protein
MSFFVSTLGKSEGILDFIRNGEYVTDVIQRFSGRCGMTLRLWKVWSNPRPASVVMGIIYIVAFIAILR